jgi:thiaminase/transcriptional activator TenA
MRPLTAVSKAVLAAVAGLASAPAAEFTEELWRGIEPIYRTTLDHPFLKGLTDGTLPRARFQFYLLQDAHYLRAFGQALSLLAAKAPKEEWAITLNQHAAESIQVERQLHEQVLGSYGVAAEVIRNTPMAPANYAYTNHLLAAAYRGSFADGLAAVLPCYWIYWEVGKELKKKGSKDKDYQRWIDQYSGEEYGAVVRQVLDMMSAEAARMDPEARQRARRLFELSARYEYMFWDMAWRREQWPPAK